MNESFIKISRTFVKFKVDPGLELQKALAVCPSNIVRRTDLTFIFFVPSVRRSYINCFFTLFFCDFLLCPSGQHSLMIIIIVIKKYWQCKAERGRLTPSLLTPYQSEDPSPALPTYRGKEEKGKIVEDNKGEKNNANKKALDLLLKPANPTPSNTGSTRSFQRYTERRIKVVLYSEVLQRGGA